jgi:glycine dehydrogenase subunit 1
MPYIPHSDADRQAMLGAIGVQSIEALFQDVPQRARFPGLSLPLALSEMEVRWNRWQGPTLPPPTDRAF